MKKAVLDFVFGTLVMLLVGIAPLRAANVLYLRDMPIGTDRVAEALDSLGHNVTFAVDADDFKTRIESGAYDLGVIFVQTRPATEYAAAIQALAAFVQAGGRALYADWSRNEALASLFGAGFTGGEGGLAVTVLDRDLAGTLVPNPIKLRNTGWFQATSGLITGGGGFSGKVAATFATGAAAIVRDWTGRSLVFGFLGDTPETAAIFARGAEAVLAPTAIPILTYEPAAPSARSARLRGAVIPTNSPTVLVIEYGLTTDYGPIPWLWNVLPGGSSPVSFDKTISGLEPHTTYHYRIRASNQAGSNSSGDLTFTTNTSPVALDDRAVIRAAISLPLQPLLNDSDADGDLLTISDFTDGEFGSVKFVGGLIYTPASFILRADHFTYTVSDGYGGTATATVFIDLPMIDVPQFRGDYTQLLIGPGNEIHGRLTLTLNAGGAFTGRLLLDGRSDPFTGVFGSDHRAHVVVSRPGAHSTEMTLSLQYDTITPSILGEITNGMVTWPMNARAVLYDSEHQPPVGKGGRYTFAALKPRAAEYLPGGDAWAVFAGEPEGRLRLSGRFADGELFFGDAQVQPDGTLPLYLLRRDPPVESLAGMLHFTGAQRRNLMGELTWNVFSTKDRLGFSTTLPVVGGRFLAPAGDEPILRFPKGSASQAVAKLFSGVPGFPRRQTFRVETNGILPISPETNPISLQFSRSTGQFTGSFDHPKFGHCRIGGVLLQRENVVRGNFSGGGISGGFRFIPRRPRILY